MKRAFSKHSRAKQFRAKTILADKLTRLRMALARRAADPNGHLTAMEYADFVKNLEACVRDKNLFADEKANAEYAMKNGQPESGKPANLMEPAHQLLWAATLLHARHTLTTRLSDWKDFPNTKGIDATRMWAALETAPYAMEILTGNASAVVEELRQPDMKFGWGGFQSGYQFDRENKQVTFDFLQSLIMGLEHANAELFKQITFARHSVSFPEKNKQLREKILKLKQREEDWGNLSSREYKELRKASLEWEMRHRFWETAEKMVAGAFAAERGLKTGQDYGYSLNHNMMTTKPYGNIALDMLRGGGQGNESADEQKQAQEEMIKALGEQIKQMEEILNDPDSGVPYQMKQALKQEIQKLKYMEKQVGDTPEKRFVNILRAVELSFFRSNGLFDDTPEGWKLMGVDVKKINKRADIDNEPQKLSNIFANDNGSKSLPADFRKLMAMCGNDSGLQSMLPKLKDRWFGKAYYDGLVSKLSHSRNALIEQMWDLYVEDLAQDILQNLEDELDEQLDEQQSQDQDGQDQDGQEGQEGQQQDGQQQDGQQGQQGQSQQGQSQDGQQQGDSSQGGQPQNGQQQDSQNQNNQDPNGQDQNGAQEQQGQDNQDGQDGQEGQQQDDQQQDGQEQSGQEQQGQQDQYGKDEQPFGEESQESSAQGDGDEFDSSSEGVSQNEDDTVDVEKTDGSHEDMRDVETPSEAPEGHEPGQDADGQDADGQDADGQEQNGQQQQGQQQDGQDRKPKTLEELRKALEEAMKQAQEEAEQQADDGQDADGQQAQGDQPGDAQGDGEGEGDMPSDQAGDGGEAKTLDDIAGEKWKSYPALVAELRPYINRTRRVMEKIRDMQVEKTVKRSRELEMLPEGMEMDRLDKEAHQNLVIKKETGEALEKEDLHRFRKDKTSEKPTTIDIVLLIDGSASMTMNNVLSGKANPMEIALVAGTILYEAAKAVDANVYIALWGNEEPLMLATPKDDPRQIGENIIKAKSGLSCGTNLAPSINKITKVLAEHRSGKFSGHTHMMVISDGDISDKEPAKKAVETLFRYSNYTTLDFAIMNKNPAKTDMELAATEMRVASPKQKISVHHALDSEGISVGIIGMLFEKIRAFKSFVAVPWSVKRKEFQRVQRHLGLK